MSVMDGTSRVVLKLLCSNRIGGSPTMRATVKLSSCLQVIFEVEISEPPIN